MVRHLETADSNGQLEQGAALQWYACVSLKIRGPIAAAQLHAHSCRNRAHFHEDEAVEQRQNRHLHRVEVNNSSQDGFREVALGKLKARIERQNVCENHEPLCTRIRARGNSTRACRNARRYSQIRAQSAPECRRRAESQHRMTTSASNIGFFSHAHSTYLFVSQRQNDCRQSVQRKRNCSGHLHGATAPHAHHEKLQCLWLWESFRKESGCETHMRRDFSLQIRLGHPASGRHHSSDVNGYDRGRVCATANLRRIYLRTDWIMMIIPRKPSRWRCADGEGSCPTRARRLSRHRAKPWPACTKVQRSGWRLRARWAARTWLRAADNHLYKSTPFAWDNGGKKYNRMCFCSL